MSAELPKYTPEDLRKAKLNEAEMLKGGAHYGDDNEFIATDEQVEAAKGEMILDRVLKTNLADLLRTPKADIETAIGILAKRNQSVDQKTATYGDRFTEETMRYLSRIKDLLE